jgi:hypothetical protein
LFSTLAGEIFYSGNVSLFNRSTAFSISETANRLCPSVSSGRNHLCLTNRANTSAFSIIAIAVDVLTASFGTLTISEYFTRRFCSI